jgi:hypothetical protein
MAESEKSMREQLREARANVRRQIEIANMHNGGSRRPDNRSVIVDLETELAQIEDAIRNLRAGNA